MLRQWREGTCPYVVECHHRHYYLEEELDTMEITLCRFVITPHEYTILTVDRKIT